MIFFFDIGIIILAIAILIIVLTSGAGLIGAFLVEHLAVVILISIAYALAVAIISWFVHKDVKVSLSSILYTSQLIFFVCYGLYKYSMIHTEPGFEGIFYFIIGAIYAIINFTLIGYALDEDTFWETTGYMAFYLAIGIVGWIINVIFLII